MNARVEAGGRHGDRMLWVLWFTSRFFMSLAGIFLVLVILSIPHHPATAEDDVGTIIVTTQDICIPLDCNAECLELLSPCPEIGNDRLCLTVTRSQSCKACICGVDHSGNACTCKYKTK